MRGCKLTAEGSLVFFCTDGFVVCKVQPVMFMRGSRFTRQETLGDTAVDRVRFRVLPGSAAWSASRVR